MEYLDEDEELKLDAVQRLRFYTTALLDGSIWASSALTDIHHQGHGPGKDVQNGDHGAEEAPSGTYAAAVTRQQLHP